MLFSIVLMSSSILSAVLPILVSFALIPLTELRSVVILLITPNIFVISTAFCGAARVDIKTYALAAL